MFLLISGSIAEKPDESLFVIENTGTESITDDKSEDVGIKTRSKLKEISSDLKYFKILEPQSKTSPITARVGPKNKRRTFLDDDQKFAKLWPQKRVQYLRAKEESEYKKQVQSDANLRFHTYDLWDDKPEPKEVDSEMEELKDYQEILKGSKPPKVPKYRYQKPSLLPTIEVPHSGQSYNPAFEDHQELLAVAHDIEVNKIKKEERFKRLVEGYYVGKTDAPNDKTWAQEMAHGLGLSDDEEEGDKEEDNSEDLTSSKLIRADKKKTKAQRRRELLKKQLEAKKKLEKSQKAKANEVFKIKSLRKELEAKEKESIERQKRKSQRIIDKLYKPKQMSRYSYDEPDVELNLSEELTGSLRSLKTEGNLLHDRFKSLQRRNIIESRTKQTFKRKYKLKKINKSTCKAPIE